MSAPPARPVAIAVGLAAAAVAAGVARFLALEAPAEPVGLDAYFHFIQVQRLVAEGRLHAPDSSWVMPLLAAGHAAGLSPRVSVDLAAALLAALCVPAAWGLGRRWRPDAPLVAWTLAGWAAASPALSHLAADFPKSLGLAAPFLLLLGVRTWRGTAGVVAASLVLACALAHRLGAAMAGVWVVGAAVGAVAAKADARTLRWALGGAVGTAFVGAAAFALARAGAEGTFLGRVTPQLASSPALLPWAYFGLRAVPWPERVELLLVWPALAVGLARWVRRPADRTWLTAPLAWMLVAVFPFWKADELDLGWRVAMTAPLAAAPVLVAALAPRPGPLAAAQGEWIRRVVPFLLLPLCVTGVDEKSAPPWARYHAVVAMIPRPLPPLAIAHQGLASRYDFDTGHEALPWAPEPELDPTRIYRLAWGVPDGAWLTFTPELDDAPAPRRLDPDYVWVREDVWRELVHRVRAVGDEELLERIADWRNPSRVRPAWLRR